MRMADALHIEAIKNALKERGLTQRQLAEALEVSAQTVTNWLKGDDFPRPKALLGLARSLRLGFDELVLADAKAPVVAFRRKGGTKTTQAHIENARHIGHLLRPLVATLPGLGGERITFRLPSCDYETVERLAAGRRMALGMGADVPLEYTHLVKAFRQNGAVLVPVLWGERHRHENALHIYLPEEDTTFVYLNLDTRVEDFRFWMAHELAHIFTPTLSGTEAGEDFADAFAGALLFPGTVAEATYHACSGKSKSQILNVLQGKAADYGLSIFTVFKRTQAYGLKRAGNALPVDERAIHQVRNGAKPLTVAKSMWSDGSPDPAVYIDAVRAQFDSSFFVALSQMLRAGKGGVGYVQQVLDISPTDADALHTALSS